MHDCGAFDENIKNLLKEEFATLKKSKKQKEASKKQLKNSDFELVNRLIDDHKQPSIASKKLADQLQIQQWKDKFLLGPEQSSLSTHEILLDKQNLEAMFGDIYSQIYQEKICGENIEKVIIPSIYNELDQVNVQLLQITAKAFIDQICINRRNNYKGGVGSKSQYISDASEILNLNMDLFLKLLQDSNSLLQRSVEHLQLPPWSKEGMKLYLDSRTSECGSSAIRNNQDPEDSMKKQKRNSSNPFWKKLKDRCGCSLKGNTTCQASKKVVILRPGSKSKQSPEDVSCHCSSLQAHQSLKNAGQNVKSTYFSFKDIKRKFKEAVGENEQKQHWISMDEHLRRLARKKHLLKDVDKGNNSGSGEGKSALPSNAKRREKQQKLVDITSSSRSKAAPSGGTVGKNLSTSSCSKQKQFDIFMEARRHLSERLRNVDMGEIAQRKEAPRTLKTVLSSPEHDLLTTRSPKTDKSASISAEMIFCPCKNIEMTMASSLQNEKGKEMDFPSPLKHAEDCPPYDCRRSDDQLGISEFMPNISKKRHADTEVPENIYSIKDDPEPSGSANIAKVNKVVRSLKISEVPYEWNSGNDDDSRQGIETTRKHEENKYVDTSDLINPLENHPIRPSLGSSKSLNMHELETVATAKYKEEHASPVSVLEPFSPEDVSSPTSIMDKQDESLLQPRCIDFDDYIQVMSPEDPKSNRSVCMDVEESLHLYVRAVMEASELSFGDVHLKGPSTQDVLYTCIADRMVSCPTESYPELQLLFDCIHDVLLGIYECHFGCPPWLSFLRQRIRPVPLEKDIVDEVVKEVNMYLLPKMQQPTLDQLVGKDIEKSSSWLDLCPDAEEILIQIAEDVLQDSIEDMLLEVQI